jgi:hypothetical protein
VAPGDWVVYPDVVGPFGPSGAAKEGVMTTMSAVANAFDPSVTPATGDLWQASTDPSVLDKLSPVVIGPGQTGTIQVTVTPSGSSGTVQSGALYIDVEDLFQFQVNADVVNLLTGNPEPNGSEVAAIPYSYTIK